MALFATVNSLIENDELNSIKLRLDINQYPKLKLRNCIFR